MLVFVFCGHSLCIYGFIFCLLYFFNRGYWSVPLLTVDNFETDNWNQIVYKLWYKQVLNLSWGLANTCFVSEQKNVRIQGAEIDTHVKASVFLLANVNMFLLFWTVCWCMWDCYIEVDFLTSALLYWGFSRRFK